MIMDAIIVSYLDKLALRTGDDTWHHLANAADDLVREDWDFKIKCNDLWLAGWDETLFQREK
jgi:hypothetical protein